MQLVQLNEVLIYFIKRWFIFLVTSVLYLKSIYLYLISINL